MQIIIRQDAAKVYMRQQQWRGNVNWEWYKMLEQIQGMTLEVETDFLFNDQYNTAPIPGVSEQGMRIMDESVDAVIDDIRQLRKRCNWCGHHSDINTPDCEYCGNAEYFETFRIYKRTVTKLDFDNALETFLSQAQAIIDNHAQANGFPGSELAIDPNGKKYIRIVSTKRSMQGGLTDQRSAYCFINRENGDILKTSSWKSPAKGARGNIYKPESIHGAVGPYGAAYLR